MKKKKLIESLNNYFSAEETTIEIPPIERIQAYSEFQTLADPPAPQPVRRSVRGIRRAVMIAACLAVAIAVAVGISASIGVPEDISDDPAAPNNGFTDKAPDRPQSPALGGAQEEVKDQPSEGNESLAVSEGHVQRPDAPSEGDGGPNCETSESEGMDEPGGNGKPFERYYPDELFNLLTLTDIVSVNEVLAAAEKLHAENAYYHNGQLPPLYLVIHELNIGKEDFIRVNNRNKDYPAVDPVYTDEQIEWLFSDADIQTVQAALKLDTALLYNGRLYNPYELLALEDSLLREMANTEEMTAYLANLNDCGFCGFAEVLKHRLEVLS